MRRTPLEIKKQQFTKSLRGYEPDEVHSFLSTLSDEWEHMINQNKQLKKENAQLSDTLKHYKQVEEALQETLHTARASSGKKIAAAGLEADEIRTRAREEAEGILQNANNQLRDVQQQVSQLLEKREELIQTVRTYLDQTITSLDEFRDQNPNPFSVLNDPERIHIPGAENIDDILDQID